MSGPQTVAMTLDDIEDLAFRALVGAGTAEANARSVARSTAAAHADGVNSHGLPYVPIYCEHVRCGRVKGDAVPAVDRPKPAVLVVDAGNGFAHPAIDAGFEQLVPLAREQGIACLAIRNSYNCGVLGWHSFRLARQGLLAIGFTNSPAAIAPAGGARKVIGTNPFTVAAPDGEGEVHVLIDQSASVIARSEVMQFARRGEPIPEGWGLDADGRPTTDPKAALAGSMLPSGGYKGFGVGLMVELFAGAAAGATLGIHASPFTGTAGGPPATGQFFIAVEAETTSGGAFGGRVADLVAAIADQPGARVHGAGRKAARARAAAGPIDIDAATVDRVRALSA
ncbi:MAG: Ldh family oxidoreductase [Rhodospirillaceae bacterium]|nr:Ldh family oxidoreductase [Rhodospirillaceae bacterium]MYB11637.1 Ldh family oxidoreductase [Rhodospirillaceae bacterium]MYI49767.1 Ldh family oxidoreductase [Rhodospirillaceae bacterium]